MFQRLICISTLRQILKLALPMMVSQGTFAVMIFTDRLFMSEISSLHIAAALGGGVASFSTICLFSGIIAYGNAMVAQYLGAGAKEKCSQVLTQGLLLAILFIPILATLTYFVCDVFAMVGHEPDQAKLEREYYLILMAGTLFSLGKSCFAAFFAGIGSTRTIMICDVLGVLVNIPLSYVLIFGLFGLPALGLNGAGIGTITATLLAMCLFIFFYLRPRIRQRFSVDKSLQFNSGILRRYFRLGLPSGLETFLTFVTFNIFILLFQSYGVVEGASVAIVLNWDILSFIPMLGVNIALMSSIGRLVGSGDLTEANRVIASGFLLGWGFSGFLGLCFILFRVPFVEVFSTPDAVFPQVRELASLMMVGLATYAMADASALVAGGVLRGAGDTRWLMTASITLHWLMLVAQYFIIRIYKLDPLVSWWAFVAMIIMLAVTFNCRLLGGRWRHPERLAAVMAE